MRQRPPSGTSPVNVLGQQFAHPDYDHFDSLHRTQKTVASGGCIAQPKTGSQNVLPLESEEFSLIADIRNRLDASVADGIERPIRIWAVANVGIDVGCANSSIPRKWELRRGRRCA